MNLLMTQEKTLVQTGKRLPIYKFETQADYFRVLIPQEFNGIDMSEMFCIIQCVLPDKKGLYKLCSYDEELYKNRLTFSVPITSTITKCAVDKDEQIEIYLLFLLPNPDDPKYAKAVIKTSSTIIDVIKTNSPDSESEEAFDEVWAHTGLDEMQKEIDELKEEKADGLELNGDMVELKSKGNTIASFQLPDDVIWEEWN